MEAVASITDRISEIQMRMSQLASLTAPVGVGVATPAPVARTTSSSSAAFGAALAQAQGTTSAVGSGLASLNSDGVPVELAGYGNGKLPDSALSSINGTSAKLWTPAARSFEALKSAAAADGVTIGITDSYRTYESQVDLAARKGLYSQGGLAAAPGTSDHGWGMALDLGLDTKALAWMRENAGDYGFVEDTPRESWHWGYHPTS